MEFKDLEETDIEPLKIIFEKMDCNNCDFTIGALYMWQAYFNYQISYYEELIFIRGHDIDNIEEQAYSIPLGENIIKGIDLLLTLHPDNLLLNVVPEEYIEIIARNYDCSITLTEEWSDYLYDFADLRDLKGKKYNKKRNLIHQFKSNYQYNFVEINSENIKDIKLQFKKWYDFENLDYSDSRDYEIIESDKMLDCFMRYNLIGGAIYIDNKLIGWTLGEIINETLFVHVEKALIEYHGAYQMLNYLFVNLVSAKRMVKFINREEDVGDLGLRKAKLSYYPLTLKRKYRVKINNKKKQ